MAYIYIINTNICPTWKW